MGKRFAAVLLVPVRAQFPNRSQPATIAGC